MKLISWLFNSVPGNAILAFLATLVTMLALGVIPGIDGNLALIISVFIVFQAVYALFGPSRATLISEEDRRKLRIASFAVPGGILALALTLALIGTLIPGLGSTLGNTLGILFFFAPALFVIYLSFKVPKFKLFDVWQADVPFEEKDDSKMRPVITIGTSKLGHDDMIECLYVTSKDKDFDQNFRSVSPFNWDLGPAESRLPRCWVRIDKSVSLSPTAFNRPLGTVDANDIPRLERALSEHSLLPENPKYAID